MLCTLLGQDGRLLSYVFFLFTCFCVNASTSTFAFSSSKDSRCILGQSLPSLPSLGYIAIPRFLTQSAFCVFVDWFRVPGRLVVGCRGGSQYFEGYRNVLRSQRFQNWIFPKYLDSTPIQNYSNIFNMFFKKMFDLFGFTYVLRSSGFQIFYQDSTIVFFVVMQNDREWSLFWTYQK